jgi:hypothetical protein
VGYPVQAACAPDGQQLAFADRRYNVQVRAASGDPLLATFRGHAAKSRDAGDPVVTPIEALTWSPDSQHMASASLGRMLHVWQKRV